jgi:hypothetical protein
MNAVWLEKNWRSTLLSLQDVPTDPIGTPVTRAGQSGQGLHTLNNSRWITGLIGWMRNSMAGCV